MATKPQPNKQDEQQAKEPAIFMPEDLIAGAEHFGTSPEMMAGALHGVTEAITREEAEKRLEVFKNKSVTPESEEPAKAEEVVDGENEAKGVE